MKQFEPIDEANIVARYPFAPLELIPAGIRFPWDREFRHSGLGHELLRRLRGEKPINPTAGYNVYMIWNRLQVQARRGAVPEIGIPTEPVILSSGGKGSDYVHVDAINTVQRTINLFTISTAQEEVVIKNLGSHRLR